MEAGFHPRLIWPVTGGRSGSLMPITLLPPAGLSPSVIINVFTHLPAC